MKLILSIILASVCTLSVAQDRVIGTPVPKPVPPAPVRGEPVPKPVPPTPVKPSKPAQSKPVKQEVSEPTAINQPVAVARNEAFAGVAQSAALVVLTPDPGGSTMNIGAANYGGQSAIGMTFAHRQGSTIFSGGAAASNSGRGLVRLSMGWSF
jgi:hypothetical protein